jgi:outer membrane lipoprotein-sorting protein
MKIAFTFLFLLAISFTSIQSQELQDVLDAYFEVIGQDAYNGVTSIKATGKSVAQGMENDFTIYQIRPNKFRLEVEIQGSKMIQSFDGEKAWYVAPWTGSTDPIEMAGVQQKNFARQADFDGMLYNYAEKGYQTELIGSEDMEGTEVFKIKQTAQDGDIFYHFIDKENNILLKTTSILKMGDSEAQTETSYSNYNEIEGMVMPYNMEVKMNGQMVSQIKIENVEMNTEFDEAVFTMPAKEEKIMEEEKTKVQPEDEEIIDDERKEEQPNEEKLLKDEKKEKQP